MVPESLQNGFIPNGLVFIFKDWANKGWFFCSGKVLLSLGAFSQIPLCHFYLKCCLHLQKRRKIPNCIWAGGFVSAVLQCLHIPTILLKGLSFFQSNSFGFKWPWWVFTLFGTPKGRSKQTNKKFSGTVHLRAKTQQQQKDTQTYFLPFQWCWRNFEIISPKILLKEEQWVKGFLMRLFIWGCWNSGWREERALWGLITLWERGQGQRLFNSILRFQNLPP